MVGPGAGSKGTETNGLQLLKDSTIVIKNGTLVFDDPKLKMGIQNYSNLTLDNVKVIGGDTIEYCVSNNYGNVVFKNHTSITPSGNNVAFDAWYGMSSVYDNPGVFVTLDDTVEINGKVEMGKHSRASVDNFATKCSITVPSSYDLVITPSSSDPMTWVDNHDGTKSFKYQATDAE